MIFLTLNHHGTIVKLSQRVLGNPIMLHSHSAPWQSQTMTGTFTNNNLSSSPDIPSTVIQWLIASPPYENFDIISFGVSGPRAGKKPLDGRTGIFWHLSVEKEDSLIRLSQGELTKATPRTRFTESFLSHVYMSTDYGICSQSLSQEGKGSLLLHLSAIMFKRISNIMENVTRGIDLNV